MVNVMVDEITSVRAGRRMTALRSALPPKVVALRVKSPDQMLPAAVPVTCPMPAPVEELTRKKVTSEIGPGELAVAETWKVFGSYNPATGERIAMEAVVLPASPLPASPLPASPAS